MGLLITLTFHLLHWRWHAGRRQLLMMPALMTSVPLLIAAIDGYVVSLLHFPKNSLWTVITVPSPQLYKLIAAIARVTKCGNPNGATKAQDNVITIRELHKRSERQLSPGNLQQQQVKRANDEWHHHQRTFPLRGTTKGSTTLVYTLRGS